MILSAAILSIPLFTQPTIMASVSGSGRTVAGIRSSVSSSSRSGGNVGGSVTTGEATSKASSSVRVSEDSVSVQAEAEAGSDGENIALKGVSSGEDIAIGRTTEDGGAEADISIRVGDGDAEETVGSPDGETDAEVVSREGEDARADTGPGRTSSWWTSVREFFGKWFRHS